MRITQDQIVDAIIIGAQESILVLTGKTVILIPENRKVNPHHEVFKMLEIAARSIEMEMSDYTMGKRRIYVDLKCLGIFMIRKHYPKFTLEQVAECVGLMGQNIICKYSKRFEDYVKTKDKIFMEKLAIVDKAVWEFMLKPKK